MQYKFYEQPDYHVGLDPTGGPRQAATPTPTPLHPYPYPYPHPYPQP